MRLEKVANSHFHKHSGVGVGFFRPRDPASGRRESILTMFVNHPQDVERGVFIRKAFRDFKWIDAGMGELIKVSLRAEDIASSGIKECCFKNECPTLPGRAGCTERETCLRKINMTRPNPKNQPEEQTRKRKAVVIDGPTAEQMAARQESSAAVMAARDRMECRAHTKGRCVNGANCTAKHTTPCSEILCNSRVSIGSKASVTNLTYGYCRLHDEAGIACPYKDCIWSETALQEPPQMTDDEAAAAAKMWDEANEAAKASAAAAAEPEKGDAGTAEGDVDMGNGDDPDLT